MKKSCGQTGITLGNNMILLYHLVFPDETPKEAWNAGKIIRFSDFVKQISWLKRHFNIITLNKYVTDLREGKSNDKKKIVITFDDGYANTLDLVSPFLESERIPATFFVSTSHLKDDHLLWFVYLNALCSEGAYPQIAIDGKTFKLNSPRDKETAWKFLIHQARESGDAICYVTGLSSRYPLPSHITHKYLGMSENQIKKVAKSQLLSLGGHTHSHPFLDQMSYEEQKKEILTNKIILESICGKEISYFAYTGGLYDSDSIQVVKECGYMSAFAIKSLKIGDDPLFELPRTDIYSASITKFQLKVFGFVNLARRLVSKA